MDVRYDTFGLAREFDSFDTIGAGYWQAHRSCEQSLLADIEAFMESISGDIHDHVNGSTQRMHADTISGENKSIDALVALPLRPPLEIYMSTQPSAGSLHLSYVLQLVSPPPPIARLLLLTYANDVACGVGSMTTLTALFVVFTKSPFIYRSRNPLHTSV